MNEIKTEIRKGSGSLSLPKPEQATVAPTTNLHMPEKKSPELVASPLTTANLSTLPTTNVVVQLRQKLATRVHHKKHPKTATAKQAAPTLTIKGSTIFDRLVSYIAHLLKMLDYLIFNKLKRYVAGSPTILIKTPSALPRRGADEAAPASEVVPVEPSDPALDDAAFEDDDENDPRKKKKALL